MDAKSFAIKAHKGQVRKVEPDKPLIVHPINVANILKEYGFSKDVIDAGYLHDVVEDKNYTLDDIKKLFGLKVYTLVKNATDEDKNLSWEERKIQKIEKLKKLDLDSKALICADKISNLEDLRNLFGKEQHYDFSKLNRGFEKQKWYYESIYNSLIEGVEMQPIFERLKFLINQVFYQFQNPITEEQKLHFKRNEIRKLSSILEDNKNINFIKTDQQLDNLRNEYLAFLKNALN
jgi:(p)ppGpp synthase/HD superfamily hydrolase